MQLNEGEEWLQDFLVDSRPRRAARARFDTPSTAWYLGYVEDGESVEMIEKKFAALEKYNEEIQQSKDDKDHIDTQTVSDSLVENKCSQSLSTEQMEDVFKMTSYFSVKNASTDRIIFPEQEENEDLELEVLSDLEDNTSLSEGEDWHQSIPLTGRKRKRRKRTTRNYSNISYNSHHISSIPKFLTKNKIKHPTEPIHTKMPKSIPKSWAIRIEPFGEDKNIFEQKKGLDENDLHYGYMTRDITKWDFLDLPKNDYLAVLMDPPWSEEFLAKDFDNIKFPYNSIKAGFIFIWVGKEDIPHIFKIMQKWNFIYVENLVWVKKLANNQVSSQKSTYFRSSKSSLFVFRKDSQEHIELRHQRNPDVIFDFLKVEDGKEKKPEAVYETIETLLPEALTTPKTCRLLELWGTPGYLRAHWLRVVKV